MPVDKFDTERYNAVESDLLEYVTALSNIVAPDLAHDSDWDVCLAESQAPYIFRRRYNNNQLNVKFTYIDYIKKSRFEERPIDIIEALGIDVEKFWYLLLFVSDYVIGSTHKTFRLKNSAKQDIEALISFIQQNESSYSRLDGVRHKEPMTLTLKIRGHRLEIDNPNALSMIAHFCNESISTIHPDSILNNMAVGSEHSKSQSIRVWLFAKLFRQFFELYPEFSGKRSRKADHSKSTLLLISKLAYLTSLTTNEDYNVDPDNLKAIIKQYRDYEIDTINAFY